MTPIEQFVPRAFPEAMCELWSVGSDEQDRISKQFFSLVDKERVVRALPRWVRSETSRGAITDRAVTDLRFFRVLNKLTAAEYEEINSGFDADALIFLKWCNFIADELGEKQRMIFGRRILGYFSPGKNVKDIYNEVQALMWWRYCDFEVKPLGIALQLQGPEFTAIRGDKRFGVEVKTIGSNKLFCLTRHECERFIKDLSEAIFKSGLYQSSFVTIDILQRPMENNFEDSLVQKSIIQSIISKKTVVDGPIRVFHRPVSQKEIENAEEALKSGRNIYPNVQESTASLTAFIKTDAAYVGLRILNRQNPKIFKAIKSRVKQAIDQLEGTCGVINICFSDFTSDFYVADPSIQRSMLIATAQATADVFVDRPHLAGILMGLDQIPRQTKDKRWLKLPWRQGIIVNPDSGIDLANELRMNYVSAIK